MRDTDVIGTGRDLPAYRLLLQTPAERKSCNPFNLQIVRCNEGHISHIVCSPKKAILAPDRISPVLCFEWVTTISICWAVPDRNALRAVKHAILEPVRNPSAVCFERVTANSVCEQEPVRNAANCGWATAAGAIWGTRRGAKTRARFGSKFSIRTGRFCLLSASWELFLFEEFSIRNARGFDWRNTGGLLRIFGLLVVASG
jgi:hypothetical protein